MLDPPCQLPQRPLTAHFVTLERTEPARMRRGRGKSSAQARQLSSARAAHKPYMRTLFFLEAAASMLTTGFHWIGAFLEPAATFLLEAVGSELVSWSMAPLKCHLTGQRKKTDQCVTAMKSCPVAMRARYCSSSARPHRPRLTP